MKGGTKGSSNQMLDNSQQNLSGGPKVALEVPDSVEGPDYWKNLVPELMKRIHPVPPVTAPKPNVLANWVA